MPKYCQLVIGPAGSGKTTFCRYMSEQCTVMKRSVHVFNIDPAAEHQRETVSIDIRDLVSLEDVMTELQYGPNGGLIYCLEYLLTNLDWLRDEIGDFEDDYLIIDCPGQIELYSHVPVMRSLIDFLQMEMGYSVCTLYLLDSQSVTDSAKYMSGMLMCMSAMVQLETPHLNLLTKVDLMKKQMSKRQIKKFLHPDTFELIEQLDGHTTPKFKRLNESIASLIDDYKLVSFIPVDISDDDSLSIVLQHIDRAIQFGEDADVNIPKDDENNENDDDDENEEHVAFAQYEDED